MMDLRIRTAAPPPKFPFAALTRGCKAAQRLAGVVLVIIAVAGLQVIAIGQEPAPANPETNAPDTTSAGIPGSSSRFELSARNAVQAVTFRDGRAQRCVEIQARDEVWLVSAREAPHPCSVDVSALDVCRLTCGCWETATMRDLIESHATDHSRVSMVYVHGNRTDLEYAKIRGLQLYDNLFGECCQSPRPPIRWILFAWKSEREVWGILRDFQVKAQRSLGLAPMFSAFLQQFDDRHLVVTGFSLGGQIAMAATSEPQPEEDARPGKYHLAIITPAYDADFTCCGLDQVPFADGVQEAVVFVNSGDRAIRIAERVVDRQNGCCPLNLEEQLCRTGQATAYPLRIVNITGQVSKRHSIVRYSACSDAIRCEIRAMAQRVHSRRSE